MSHLPSEIKKRLGGKMTSKALRKDKDARSAALHNKIEGKRKGARKDRDEKELSGNRIFRD